MPAHVGSAAHDAAAHPDAGTPVVTAERAAKQAAHGHADEQGDAGHGSSHDHSVSCMASSATAAFGAVTIADAAALVVAALPPQTHLRASALHAAEQLAPGIATFCVLRT